MGLLDTLAGNAGEMSPEQAEEILDGLLLEGEMVGQAYQHFRDAFVITDKRFILVDVQGMTGKKVAYLSVPYHRISQFSVETAGTFDRDSELVVSVAGGGEIRKSLSRKIDIRALQRVLAKGVMG